MFEQEKCQIRLDSLERQGKLLMCLFQAGPWCSPGSPQTPYVADIDLELDPPASASQMQGLYIQANAFWVY